MLCCVVLCCHVTAIALPPSHACCRLTFAASPQRRQAASELEMENEIAALEAKYEQLLRPLIEEVAPPYRSSISLPSRPSLLSFFLAHFFLLFFASSPFTHCRSPHRLLPFLCTSLQLFTPSFIQSINHSFIYLFTHQHIYSSTLPLSHSPTLPLAPPLTAASPAHQSAERRTRADRRRARRVHRP